MTEWDPIGVSDVPEAADEYNSYIGGVYELPERGSSEAKSLQIRIYSHLRNIEVDRMETVDFRGEPLLPDTRRIAAASSLKELRRLYFDCS